MAEIEITLPTVQYGNIKVKATPEEWGLDDISDAPDLGVWAATYLNLFIQGYAVGARMDVDAHLGASQEAPAPKPRTINQILSDEDVDTVAEAQAILDKELGGTTEVEPDKAPWNEPAVDSKPKPWETEW